MRFLALNSRHVGRLPYAKTGLHAAHRPFVHPGWRGISPMPPQHFSATSPPPTGGPRARELSARSGTWQFPPVEPHIRGSLSGETLTGRAGHFRGRRVGDTAFAVRKPYSRMRDAGGERSLLVRRRAFTRGWGPSHTSATGRRNPFLICAVSRRPFESGTEPSRGRGRNARPDLPRALPHYSSTRRRPRALEVAERERTR